MAILTAVRYAHFFMTVHTANVIGCFKAYFIAVPDGGGGEHTGGFRSEFALGIRHRTEVRGGADIDHEQDREFAFFGEEFHMGFSGAGGDVPINGADVVAGNVVSNTIKIHAAALEDTGVAPGERIIDETIRADFHAPDAAEDFRSASFVLDADRRVGFRFDHGTGNSSRMRVMIFSLSSPSASAS